MGLSPFRGCFTSPAQPAPNPDPSRWELLRVIAFARGYALCVKYLDCTNFEGIKVMVFRGTWIPGNRPLDPHFAESSSLVARFRPDAEGWKLAQKLAGAL